MIELLVAIYKIIAFKGLIPRCIRNAFPTEAALFLDPQHTVLLTQSDSLTHSLVQAGVPLLLQNENPAGGLVVAAFSIAGAVLENDRDNFRFLNPEEIEWRSSEVWE